MNRTWIMGFVVAGGMVLASAGTSQAQLSVAVGNPWTGRGVYVGSPYYGGGTAVYSPGFSYSSGYSGFAAPAYGYSPGVVYGGGGYPVYTRSYYAPYGYRRGWGPFRRNRWW